MLSLTSNHRAGRCAKVAVRTARNTAFPRAPARAPSLRPERMTSVSDFSLSKTACVAYPRSNQKALSVDNVGIIPASRFHGQFLCCTWIKSWAAGRGASLGAWSLLRGQVEPAPEVALKESYIRQVAFFQFPYPFSLSFSLNLILKVASIVPCPIGGSNLFDY